MKKALQVASVASMIDQFNMENIKILQDLGYTVDVAANFDFGNTSSESRVNEFKKELEHNNIKYYNLLFNRNIFSFINLKVYRKLKKIINENNYDIIHCHSPIGGVITRLAARKARKKGTKVIYTAHGFHFFKGAAIINWLIYFPIEWINSFFTDILITINKEDYKLANRFMHSNKIEYIRGIGIDTEKYKNIIVDYQKKRKELGIYDDKIILLSVGELSKRKNHEVVIRALAKMENKNLHYIICGKGKLLNKLRTLSKELQVDNQISFLGFRKDIIEIIKISDVFIFPSLQEGLPVALMEAMAAGLPCIVNNIRGNSDLITNNENGYIFDIFDEAKFIDYLMKIFTDEAKKIDFITKSLEKIKEFDHLKIFEQMKCIYEDIS